MWLVPVTISESYRESERGRKREIERGVGLQLQQKAGKENLLKDIERERVGGRGVLKERTRKID